MNINLSPALWSSSLKFFIFIVIFSSILMIVNAYLSAKSLGGELGKGLKKVAIGTAFYAVLFISFLVIENRGKVGLSDDQFKFSFLVINSVGSLLLNAGYWQMYRISRKLKLF